MDRRRTRWAPWALGALVLAIILLIPLAANPDLLPKNLFTSPTPQPQGGSPPEEEEVIQTEEIAIRHILDNPNLYLGQTVTVNGEVDKVLDSRVFVIDQEGTVLGTGDEILVISSSNIPPQAGKGAENPLVEAQDIVVTGVVRMMNVEVLERELGIDLSQDVEKDFKDKPVIIAFEVKLVEETSN